MTRPEALAAAGAATTRLPAPHGAGCNPPGARLLRPGRPPARAAGPLVGALLLAMTLALAPPAAAKVAGDVVALTTQPGSRLERDASRLMAEDLASAKKAHETPVMLVGSARLGGPHAPAALFVQVQSASLCGSAGCSTSVFVRHGTGWTRVLDSVSGPVKVAPAMHAGMHDLLVHSRDRWIWNGTIYADTLPAPKLPLR